METHDENAPDLQGYLTVNQAAERMGLSAETVRGLCRDGVLPDAVQERASGPWRIPTDTVETWLRQKKITPLRKRVWLAVGVLATIAAIIGAVFAFPSSLEDILNLSDRWKNTHPTPTPLPFQPSKENETLIVIASFVHTEGVVDADIAHEIQRAIRQAAQEVGATNIRVEVEPTRLLVDDKSGAEVLGKQHGAGIVIWGADTGVRVAVNFFNLKQPCSCAANVQISETERSQIANPKAFASFVTGDLPPQLTFLALFAVGQSFYSSKAYSESMSVIEKGIQALPKGTKSPEGLAEAHLLLGWLHQTLGKSSQAIESYTKAIALDQKNVMAYNNRGNAFNTQGDLQAAIADFNQAIALDSKLAQAYNNRGAARAAQGDRQAAVADFNQAIVLDPQYAMAYSNRGAARAAQGDIQTAIADFDQAISLDPQDAIAYDNRGNAYIAKGDLQTAIADFNQAIALDPKLADAYYDRGNTYTTQGNFLAAIVNYDQAIAVDPQNAAFYNNRGNAHAAQGDIQTAIADYNQAIILDPQNANYYTNRGTAHAVQGDLPTAIADYNRAVDFNPQFAGAYYSRGLAHNAQGNLQAAVADYRRYLELQPDAADRRQVEQWIAKLEQRSSSDP